MPMIEKPGAKALRRSVRIPKEIPIVLIGPDVRGREFVEQTKTVVLSRHGAGIVSKHKLGVEQELIIIQEQYNREAEIRVVGEIGSEDGLYTYGVTFLDPDIDFWGIGFGSATDAGTSDLSMAVQCNICGRREVIDLDGLESDVYAMHDGPVVVVSIVARENRGKILGAVDVLEKPLTREDLLTVLRRTLPTMLARQKPWQFRPSLLLRSSTLPCPRPPRTGVNTCGSR